MRLSYGSSGNDRIDADLYQKLYGVSSSRPAGWGEVSHYYYNFYNSKYVYNPDVKWETTITRNIGIDFGFFKERLSGTIDVYWNTVKDLLVPSDIPGYTGYTKLMTNVGQTSNRGIELQLNAWLIETKDFSLNATFNIGHNKNKIDKLASGEKEWILTSAWRNDVVNSEDYRAYVGGTSGLIYGYVNDGFYTVADFESFDSKSRTWKLKEGVVTEEGVSPRPGDIKYQNLRDDGSSTNRIDTGDGTFDNPGDRKIIGNNSLRLQYGINLGVNYKGFDLSVLLQGVGKRDVWISDARRWPFNSGQFGSLFKDQLDYWKPVDSANGDWTAANPNAEYFRIYVQGNNSSYNTRAQTKYLMNGSYLRVKNVTLSYNFPQSWLAPITLTSLKAFLSCENLHTFTKLMKGYDPERLSWGYPFYRTISFGFNVTL